MSALREKYWILKSRKTIKKAIKSCIVCRRFNSKPPEVQESVLPENRVKDASVFEILGIDLAGPLILKDNSKVWILIFTCAVFRAVHVEMLTSVSTDNFLLGLRRFIARRGRPSIIYSDNGKNFVGAKNQLSKIDWKKIQDETTASSIAWIFIPPSAPWWGGFWERLVGVLKRILRKVLGQTSLDYEEMLTVLCDCESIINSRPLTYVSDDVQDLTPITPSMFLQEIREIGVPDLDVLDHQKLNKRHAYTQKIRKDLRSRFRVEYLGQLRQPVTNRNNSPVLKVGDLVIVWTDNCKRIDWPLGRVLEVFTSKDGCVRVAKVKTKTGVFIRPVKKLCSLELGAVSSCELQKLKPLL
ncbi:uncharacterized protein LOC129222408 [Uloborus diversus]|uniref:uncharacterized protein LOC129222408 n=1 Tax=Uloborus diversus TaxID=327109 RepID=UPI0024098ABB|nr:uncharacterized protein LOC129222408 [Uloborus diversus]